MLVPAVSHGHGGFQLFRGHRAATSRSCGRGSALRHEGRHTGKLHCRRDTHAVDTACMYGTPQRSQLVASELTMHLCVLHLPVCEILVDVMALCEPIAGIHGHPRLRGRKRLHLPHQRIGKAASPEPSHVVLHCVHIHTDPSPRTQPWLSTKAKNKKHTRQIKPCHAGQKTTQQHQSRAEIASDLKYQKQSCAAARPAVPKRRRGE